MMVQPKPAMSETVSRANLKGKKPYEWPRPAYQLLQEMIECFGVSLGGQIETFLAGDAEDTYLSPREEKEFREAAAKHGVRL